MLTLIVSMLLVAGAASSVAVMYYMLWAYKAKIVAALKGDGPVAHSNCGMIEPAPIRVVRRARNREIQRLSRNKAFNPARLCVAA